MEVVVDASVVVKWFVEEEYSDRALLLRDRYIEGEINIIAPELLISEVLNALYYKGLFSESEMEEVAEALEAFAFTLFPLKGYYARKTVETTYRNEITVYDSSYVTLAMMRDTYVCTADESLTEKLKSPYRRYVKNIREFGR